MKQMTVNATKDEIIVSVFDYIETKAPVHSDKAVSLLSDLAKFYGIPLKKVAKIDLKRALRSFILNEQGYITTINQLYYSLV